MLHLNSHPISQRVEKYKLEDTMLILCDKFDLAPYYTNGETHRIYNDTIDILNSGYSIKVVTIAYGFFVPEKKQKKFDDLLKVVKRKIHSCLYATFDIVISISSDRNTGE